MAAPTVPGTPVTPPTRVAQPKRKGKPKPPPDETKEARFIRLANMRVNAALKRLSHISNLSSRASYTYTPEQADKIIKILTQAVETVKQRFAGTKDVNGGFML